MMNWAKATLANVAGTQEPVYGPSAIQAVTEQAKTTPWTGTTKEDIRWAAPEFTSVETQSFYLMSDSGHIALAQVIYSNVVGLRTTCQFNTKIFYPGAAKPNLWSSDQLSNVEFNEDKTNFYADNCAVELSEDGKSYSIKSMTNEASIVNLTITQTAPGFQVGNDGKTNFGTDPAQPWGTLRHVFWPRNVVEGSIVTKDGPIDFKGKALFVHALQAMKPHHAAAQWNFVDFQSPTYSAIMMEFTTPASYGSTVVNVGGLAKDGEVICASASNTVAHTEVKSDAENGWPAPEAIKYSWVGTTKDGKAVEAVLEGPLGVKLDRVDIMAEVPGFVKKFVSGTVGTKPYIYQVKIGDEETTEKGVLFSEATFISA
ncbi:survival factor 1 [Phlyctema vagabunda]|uniref:Survival factor 1 n=1 Tax=Phlyctema vagabunda TaxID=108571 RepID=A0ABR4PVM0_9HELO